MPARSPIVINDGETTPVAHTFNPGAEGPNGFSQFRESTGVPTADAFLSLQRWQQTNKHKLRFRMSLPVVQTETINGISRPSTLRTSYFDGVYTFADGSETQERDNLITLIGNLHANSDFLSLARDLEYYWG